jgi:membrane fusion protein (multidrug efflux system)
VKAGNLVGRGENTLLVTISQIDPILFRVGMAEAEYLGVARRVQEQNARGVSRQQIPIQLFLADGTAHPHVGYLDTVERNVETTTGTIAMQIKFPNPNRLVRPGQFGRVKFDIDVKKGALLVPQRAVQELQNLHSIAVVGADNKVSFRNVTVGPREGSLWVIEDGLKPGEQVIVAGLQKVRDGQVVSPKPAPAETAGGGATSAEAAPAGAAKAEVK